MTSALLLDWEAMILEWDTGVSLFQTAQLEREQQRHALPDCFLPASVVQTDGDREVLSRKLKDVPVDKEVLFELERHKFVNSTKSVPMGPFNAHFPHGWDVNKYECTAAFAYSQGSCLAPALHHLSSTRQWDLLFQEYGRCIKALWSYCEKMQEAYGTTQELYRGTSGDWSELREKYTPGTRFVWTAFTSASTDRGRALSFSGRGFGEAVFFVIRALNLGAPLFHWSEQGEVREVLLQPFQAYEVREVSIVHGMLQIELQTLAREQPTEAATQVALNSARLLGAFNRSDLQPFRVVNCAVLAYRCSPDLADCDEEMPGADNGEIVVGAEANGWLITHVPDAGMRFLPISINGEVKLVSCSVCPIL